MQTVYEMAPGGHVATDAIVAEIEGICVAMVVAGLLEVRPVVDEAPEGVAR
jgi:hypothetical protein